jgi:Family of unknown function (DUF6527)
MSPARWLHRAWARLAPRRKLQIIEGDSLPRSLPRRNVVLARDSGEDWCVGLRCPCGCARTIELLLISEAKPRWDLITDRRGRPSLFPSVWLRGGCRSHFWLREGRIEWCD